ncbi:MAG: ribonuclease III [Chthoniobacterales bacterium]|nr:ribonuclease III [Chthoniobacterales bacterium]
MENRQPIRWDACRQIIRNELLYFIPISPMKALEEKIDYHFKNQELLREAITHSSTSFDRGTYFPDNERLEFLGDAVLQLVITQHLFEVFPDFKEGQLTKIRTHLVSRTALQAYAAGLELGNDLFLGRGEEASGGRKRSSILGDAFEALIGAIYIDGGLEVSRTFILKQAAQRLQGITAEPEDMNPKGRLQELLQSLGSHAPSYELIEESGFAHSKHFRCAVLLENKILGTGEGKSKKEAEVAAATEALSQLSKE